MRLNRRGLGTGLLRSRIVPAGLLVVAAGAALLSLAPHPQKTSQASPSPLSAMAAKPSLGTKAKFSGYAHLPLMFEPNQGQTAPEVRFIARGAGYGLFLTEREAVLSLSAGAAGKPTRSAVHMKLAGANERLAVEGSDPLPGKSNYFVGNDPSKWHRNVPQYARVRYAEVYPGVDLVYYGNQGNLEYDFQVAPGADPKKIQLTFEGTRDLKLADGDLVLATAAGDVRLEAPRVYQADGAVRKPVAGSFVLLAEDRVGFSVGAYDRSKTLIIDPALNYSSYLGGGGTERLPSIAVDSALDMYVAGTTNSTDFPVTDGSTFKTGATSNIFVAKFDPTGANLIFATYLGGTGADTSVGVAVDAALNVYLAGTTTSTDFPTSPSAFQGTPKSPGLPHAFVTQLTMSGALQYSTYLSGTGTDTASGMTLDNKGFVYVIGITNSTDFPLAPVAGTFQSTLQGAKAFFISKVAPTSTGANSLSFSTYFGGGFPTTGTVTGGAIAVDNNANVSNIYLTGGTTFLFTGQNSQTDFPIKNAYQSCLGTAPAPAPQTCPTSVTQSDAFIAKLSDPSLLVPL